MFWIYTFVYIYLSIYNLYHSEETTVHTTFSLNVLQITKISRISYNVALNGFLVFDHVDIIKFTQLVFYFWAFFKSFSIF